MQTSVLYPCTNFKQLEKLIITSGKGVFIYDDQGREYLDSMSGLWCLSLGYGNEELIAASTKQMQDLAYSNPFGGKSHPTMISLAETLAQMTPIENAKVFFGQSGSDANDSQIKILRYYANVTGQPKRKKILAGTKAYHGVGIGSVAMTGLTGMHTNFDVPFEELGIMRFPTPYYYRMAYDNESESEFVARMANDLEEQIVKADPETILAYISEPLQGAGGVIIPGSEYFSLVQPILKKYGILFIDDEVICGFGRTGNDFGATTFGIKPDTMTLAKALTSGYLPLSATILPDKIYQALIEPSDKAGVFGHGFTYSGHPVSCALALAAIQVYQRDNIFQQAKEKAIIFQKKLQSLESHPLVGDVRGCGMIGALELVCNKRTKENFSTDLKIALVAQQACQKNGLIVRGIAGNSIAVCPPLIISDQEIDELFERFKLGLDATLSAVSSYVS